MARSSKIQEPVKKATDPYTDSSGGWPAPLFDDSLRFHDVGSTGLRQYSGWIKEDFIVGLQGRQAARVYREMADNSAVVGAVLFVINQTMRKIEWRVIPAYDSPQAIEAAEFADSLRFDMSHTWEDFISEALSMLPFGFCLTELVYKQRLGKRTEGFLDQTDEFAPASSRYNDGKIGLRRLPIRSQDTILKWFLDSAGVVTGVTQQPWIGQLIDIPIKKLLLFRPSSHKNNPEGRSILRTSWQSYYYVKRLQEQEAILFERLSGLPMVKVPNSLIDAAASGDANAQASLNAFRNLVRNVRVDEQMGIIIPSDPFMGPEGPTNTPMYDFKLITPDSTRFGGNVNQTLERLKIDIMQTVMADFINLGHQARGTQSLALAKTDLFLNAVESWLNSIAAVLNRYLLPRIWDLNNFDPDLMPQFVPDLAQRVDLDAISNFILRLSQAGMPMFPDSALENYLRDSAGLPDLVEEIDYADAPDQEPVSEAALQAPSAPPLPPDAPAPGVKPNTPSTPGEAAAKTMLRQAVLKHLIAKGRDPRRAPLSVPKKSAPAGKTKKP